MTAPWNSAAVREAFPPYTLRDLGQGVQRITAPNPGPLTGPGTNTYLVGEQAVAVIDPGVRDTRHLDTILAAADGRIRWILLTHTHPDHSPGARELAEATGARQICCWMKAMLLRATACDCACFTRRATPVITFVI